MLTTLERFGQSVISERRGVEEDIMKEYEDRERDV